MTTALELITDAYRQSNILAIGITPTVNQQTEALRYLNRILKSVFGNEAGEPLTAFPIGRGHVSRPAGYPWWDNTPDGDWFVPPDTRLVFNITEAVPIYLNPDPHDGSRFAVNDAGKNFATNNVTLYGNGRLIEDAFQITLNTNGYSAEWFYRGDLGNWLKYAPLDLSTVFPFPEEFDFYFITLLGIALNPAYGVELSQEVQLQLARYGKQIRARYTQDTNDFSELGLIRNSRMTQDRDLWGAQYWWYQPNAMFNKGWPF